MVILFYSGTDENCKAVYQEYLFAASHFEDKQTHLTRKVGKDMKRPIFFAALKLNQDTIQIFKDLDFRGVPNILISTPEEVAFKDPLDRKMHQRQYLWEIQPSDGLITAKKLVVWLSDKTKVGIAYQESIWTFLESMLYFIALVAVIYLIYVKLNWLLLHPLLWLLVFFFGYYISCAGIVYCILNNAPWVGQKDGKPEYIDPSGRSQFISEGLLMSGSSSLISNLVLGVSALWIVFLKVPQKIENPVPRKIVLALLLFAIWRLVAEVEDIFKSKNAYNPNYLPPAHYRHGSLRMDQGHTV